MSAGGCMAQQLLPKKRPKTLCEVHSEENKRILQKQFARFGCQCRMLDENHLPALPR